MSSLFSSPSSSATRRQQQQQQATSPSIQQPQHLNHYQQQQQQQQQPHHNQHPQHPNNSNEMIMERVLFHLHVRLCNLSLLYTSAITRRVLEFVWLIIAICCFGALLLLHRNFVVTAASSSSSSSSHNNNNNNVCLSAHSTFQPHVADITHIIILPSTSEEQQHYSRVLWKNPPSTIISKKEDDQKQCIASYSEGNSGESCINNQDRDDKFWIEWIIQHEQNGTLPIYFSYSTTKAYLMLPWDHHLLQDQQEQRDDDKQERGSGSSLSIQYVLLSPHDLQCFGEPFHQFLIWNCFIGPDTILYNWIISFHASRNLSTRRRNTVGYVYNPRTQQFLKELPPPPPSSTNDDKESSSTTTSTTVSSKLISWIHRLPMLSSKILILFQTTFLFFFCTTLVSFTLRETQEKMLDFTRELSRRTQLSLPVSNLITTHLIQNLVFVPIMVGMMFFLIEFYGNDKFLAFSISSIVWSVEAYSVVCVRSTQGMCYFPKFFFLLFVLFHIYQNAFRETGFVYCALTVVWCFMFHSMLFFWHRFELPAVVLGYVNIHRPRMTMASNNDQHQEQQQSTTPNRSSTNENTSTARTPRIGNVGGDTTTRRTTTMDETTGQSSAHHQLPFPQPLLAATRSTSSTTSSSGGQQQQHHHHQQSQSPAATGGVYVVPTHPSFSTTASSSRHTGLFRNNHEDDNSTGSHLYFMGGEVVVHRASAGNATEMMMQSSSESPSAVMAGVVVSRPQAVNVLSRNESNYSLPSTASDAMAGGHYGYEGNSSAGDIAVGLDVSERDGSYDDDENKHDGDDDDDDDVGDIPNASSMETVPSSNLTPRKQPYGYGVMETNGNTATFTDYYAQESGGLQAILESRMTPRHRNTEQHDDGIDQHQQQDQPQEHPSSAGMLLDTRSSNASATHSYQRTPPTFPDLPK
jgi:hypothetical protein